ncbi:MAG TPA: VCBS repeat-containing protein [Chloroflexia bacterium]|nr:VCBS repeat-containing protein [Chloroflexia bacterium]
MRTLVARAGLITISLLFLAGTAQAVAQPATFTTQTYPLLGNNHIAADVNGDGKLDLVGAGLNSAFVMLNNGDGTFRPKVAYPVADQAQDLAAGDFNGDGRVDLAVTINAPQISLSLLTGNGDGTFNAPVNFPNTSGFDSPSIAATDLNNDGRLDAVIAHAIACWTAPCRVGRTISAMLGNGDGTFQPSREIDVGTGMSRIAVGDFNRDGIRDLAICGDNTQLYTLLGVGDGTFVQQPTIMLVPGGDLFSSGSDVRIADFNRDAIQDLVVALPGNGRGTAIVLGNGNGTFGQPFRVLDDALEAPQGLGIADFNIDGFQDIARSRANGNSGLMDILHGNGDGTFQPPVRYQVPPPQSSIGGIVMASDDFNNDGKPDIAMSVGGASPALKVSLNSSGAPPPPPPPTATPTATRTPTPASTPTPSTVTVSSVTLNPGVVTGGNSSTGTIRLSTSVQAATTIQLASSNAAATVPSSVTVPAGASSANFTVNTARVSSATTATITATLNGTSRSASLTINPQATDTVSITRAEYESSQRRLRIEATSSSPSATLTAYVTSTGQQIGTLTNEGGGRYRGQFTWSTNPQNITVRSSLGGSATRGVTAR